MKKGEKVWGKVLFAIMFIFGCSLLAPAMGVRAASLYGKNNEEKIFFF